MARDERMHPPAMLLPMLVIVLFSLVSHLEGTDQTRSTSVFENRLISVPHRSENGSNRIIDEDLVIEEGETLRIEKGSTLKLKSGINLTVKGRLIVDGEPEDRVSLMPSRAGKPWGSIIIDSTGFAHLRHVTLSGATRGIICNNSSPVLENVDISEATNGVVIIGSSRPLIRNVTFTDVTNSIGITEEVGACEPEHGGVSPWKVTLSGPRGDARGTTSLLSSGFMDGLLRDNGISADVTEVSGRFERELFISRDEADGEVSAGRCRLVLRYADPVNLAGRVKVTVNGVIQGTTYLSDAGMKGDNNPDNGAVALTLDRYLERYGKSGIESDGKAPYGEPLPSNIIPVEYAVVLRDGMKCGNNTIVVEMDGLAPGGNPPSVRIEYSPGPLPVFDNVSIVRGGDWGAFIRNGAPVFSRMTVGEVSRHAVVRGQSAPVFIDCRFRGDGAYVGIRSPDDRASVSAWDCVFSNFDVPALEVSRGTVALGSSKVVGISCGNPGAVMLEGNPLFSQELREYLELRPAVMYDLTFTDITGWALRAGSTPLWIGDSVFSDCGNGLYAGEGIEGKVFGCEMSNISGKGLLLWRCIDGKITVEGNTFSDCSGGGIAVKECGAVLEDNAVLRCGVYRPGHAVTAAGLAALPWGIYAEGCSVSMVGNELRDNGASVMLGWSSTGTLERNTITGKVGIGIAVLPSRGVMIRDSVIDMEGGIDILVQEEADVAMVNCTYSTKGDISQEGEHGNGNIWVVPVAILLLMVVIVISIRKILVGRRQA